MRPAPTVSSRTPAKGAARRKKLPARRALPAAKDAIARTRSRRWRARVSREKEYASSATWIATTRGYGLIESRSGRNGTPARYLSYICRGSTRIYSEAKYPLHPGEGRLRTFRNLHRQSDVFRLRQGFSK